MKKALLILTTFIIVSCAKAQISDDKIYLFYSQNCGYCHVAMKDIATKYPKLELELVDVAKRDGYQKMIACAKKHDLGNRIGTPLFCIGDNYMMGWSNNSIETFGKFAQPLMKQQ